MSEQTAFHMVEKRAMTVAHIRTRQHKTSGKNDETMVARHKQTLFSSSWMPVEMSSLVRYSFFTVMRVMTAKKMMIAIRIVHAVGLSCSNQLMISNQNTHAFSSELHRYPCTSSDKSQIGRRTTWTSGDKTSVQPAAMSPIYSANHLEKEKSGHVPTNTCQFTSKRNKCQNLILKDSRQRYYGSSCKLRTCLEAR